MKRYELKYILTAEQTAFFKERIKGHMQEDKYGLCSIASLYYDTPNYRLIRTSIEKPKFKEKIRLRSYGLATDSSPVYLELKRKAYGIVYKRRVQSTIPLVNKFFGGEGVAWTGDAKYVMFSVIVFTLWADLGYNIILFCAGIDGIPGEVYEAADLDGAGGWKKWYNITLPLLGRTTTFVILMTLISYFQMFAQFSVLLFKDGPQNSGLVLTSYIYENAFIYKQMGYAAALSVVLFLLITIVSLVQQRINRVDWEY